MKKIVVVQARMTSNRLPGKVLLDINGKSVLRHVLSRCAMIEGVEEVCCAIPFGSEHDQVASEASESGAVIVRGPEDNVLERYANAARQLSADVIMRVTSDCPLISTTVCSKVLSQLQTEDADYSCNNMPPSWPHGLDCEAFTAKSLFSAEACAADKFSKEHVTPWIRTNESLKRVNVRCQIPDLPSLRLTLDYPEDYIMLRQLFMYLGSGAETADLQDILDVISIYPEVLELNSGCIDKSRLDRVRDI